MNTVWLRGRNLFRLISPNELLQHTQWFFVLIKILAIDKTIVVGLNASYYCRKKCFFIWDLNILLEWEFPISVGISFQTLVPINFNVCLTMLVLLCFGVLRLLPKYLAFSNVQTHCYYQIKHQNYPVKVSKAASQSQRVGEENILHP